jgi:hypothetical protein
MGMPWLSIINREMKKISSITSSLAKLIGGSSYTDSDASKTMTIAASAQGNRAGKFKRIIGILCLQRKFGKRVTESRAVENDEIFDHLFITKHPKQSA